MSGELRERDFLVVQEQLGREPTTAFTVTVRCGPHGHPLVICNAPFDADGHPFPTRYYLTCPVAVKAVSRIESTGQIATFNGQMAEDEVFAAAVHGAHAAYARDRAAAAQQAEPWGGVGGTRTGVKCLHAHYAYHLVGGEDPVGAWVAEQVEPLHEDPQAGERVAVIDQGTNSIRLLVAEPRAGDDDHDASMGAFLELARDMVITRLGQGVDRTGQLAPEALERTIDVLGVYARRARALGAQRWRMAATSAVRDASNRESLAASVRSLLGVELEVISGETEAGLSFLGATRGLERPAPLLVIDIGGGSTEFVIGDERGPMAAHSTQMGSVRLTERHLAGDPPTRQELEHLREDIARTLAEVDAMLPSIGEAKTLVAVAGTPTTLQAIALGLERYDPDLIHRSTLTIEAVERIGGELAQMTNAERAALPVMAPGRGDVILAGIEVLALAMRRFGFAEAVVSEEDILDGLAVELLASR